MTVKPAKVSTLADRISAALRDETSSEVIASLITEAEQAKEDAEANHKISHARALDPTLGAEAAGRAKHDADVFNFQADRFATALEALQRAFKEAKTREEDVRRRAAYDEAKTERDALVEELRGTYPDLERRLADLIGKLASSDATLERVNNRLPHGCAWLAGAEEIARGGEEKFGGRREYLSLRLTTLTRLPRFEARPLDPLAWPPNTH